MTIDPVDASFDDPFDALVFFKADLLIWAHHSSPVTNEDKANIQQVLALHDKLAEQLNALLGKDLETALKGLPDDAARLEKATQTMKSIQDNIANVQRVIDTAGTVLEVVAKLAPLAVAA